MQCDKVKDLLSGDKCNFYESPKRFSAMYLMSILLIILSDDVRPQRHV